MVGAPFGRKWTDQRGIECR